MAQPQAATEPDADKVPMPKPAPAGRQAAEQPSGPGNKEAIADYMAGKGGFSQDEMTQILDRVNQADPKLAQNGTIREAFKGMVDKGDMDGASKFLQALRPSYDSVRALMIAATAKGDFNTAMAAERMNNLILSGRGPVRSDPERGLRPSGARGRWQFNATAVCSLRQSPSACSMSGEQDQQELACSRSAQDADGASPGALRLTLRHRAQPCCGTKPLGCRPARGQAAFLMG
jgi:hypothetical protein